MLEKKRLLVLCLLGGALTLACNKNKYVADVDLASASALLSMGGFANYSLSSSSGTEKIKLNVAVPIASELKKDVAVKVVIDTSLLGNYNRVNFTNYLLPASDAYQFSGESLTIPKGQSKIEVPLSVNKGAWLFAGDRYAIPVRLVSVGTFPLDPRYSTAIINLLPSAN